MYSFKMSKVIAYIIASLHYLGIWHRDDVANNCEKIIKLFYFTLYTLYLISLTVGAIVNGNNDERIFLIAMSIVALGSVFKLWMLIWRQNQVSDIINRICKFSVQDYDSFKRVNDKLSKFINLIVVLFVCLNIGGAFATLVLPFVGSDNKLFYNIALPFDSGSNKITFFIASAFIFIGVNLTIISFLLNVVIWYSMIICALRYDCLGNEIRSIGTSKCAKELKNERKIDKVEEQETFRNGLINAIYSHRNIRKYYSSKSSM